MQLTKFRLKGSSLMEVVTAMVIISLSIALTGVLFANVFNSSKRMLKQQAWFKLNEIGNITFINKDITEIEIELSPLVIKKKSIVIDKERGLWLVVLEAQDQTGEVLTRRRLFIETFDEVSKDR
jgi:hypothetical protein